MFSSLELYIICANFWFVYEMKWSEAPLKALYNIQINNIDQNQAKSDNKSIVFLFSWGELDPCNKWNEGNIYISIYININTFHHKYI